MPNCNPITISNCPPANNCDACKEIVNTNCVKYTGVALPCIDVTTNQNLTSILVDINAAICELSASGGTGACNCTPQACVKLHKIGEYEIKDGEFKSYYNFFSCSATNIPGDCTKTYSIFTSVLDVEVFSGTLSECYDYRVSLDEVTEYYIVEYITCADGTSESVNQPFMVHLDELLGMLVIVPTP